MTPEQELNETKALLAEAIALLHHGKVEECRKVLTKTQGRLSDAIKAMKLRAAYD